MLLVMIEGELTPTRVILPDVIGSYDTDQDQADFATKFIGYPSSNISPLNAYKRAFKKVNAVDISLVNENDIVLVMVDRDNALEWPYTLTVGGVQHSLTSQEVATLDDIVEVIVKKPVFIFRGSCVNMSDNEQRFYNAFEGLMKACKYTKCGCGSDMLWVKER